MPFFLFIESLLYAYGYYENATIEICKCEEQKKHGIAYDALYREWGLSSAASGQQNITSYPYINRYAKMREKKNGSKKGVIHVCY